MIILIDQDGPLADFERGFLKAWRRQFPNEFHVPLHKRRSFYVRDDYPEHLREKVESIYFAPGFYRSLPPILGAVETLTKLAEFGHDIQICTSPLSRYENCVLEKYQWVEEHLGREFTKRIILSKDKTMVMGDVLLDDKPEVKGLFAPVWEHILFACHYNQHVTGKRRVTWNDFAQIINAV